MILGIPIDVLSAIPDRLTMPNFYYVILKIWRNEETRMFQEIQEALLKGNKAEVETLVDKALSSGLPASRILNEGLIKGMETLGELYKNNEIFIPEVLVAARAMNAGLAKLEPWLVKDKVQPKGVVVIGTAKGDLHDIGKNLVAMMLRGSGYKIVDLGIDVSAEMFIEAAKANNAGIIALSALLTTTMVGMKGIIEAVRAAGLKVPIIIGGAPVTRDYAARIHADGYAPDAASAVEEVGRLLA
jgi:5-methyltetrahydrofolate--homocysteine methyltransferase